MGIRDQAQHDLNNIFSDSEGPGNPYILIAPNNDEYTVCGTYGDIALLIDPTNGTAIKGRTISATYPMAMLKIQTDQVPEKKWRVKVKDLSGADHILFIVDPPDHDNTIGLTRLTLGVNTNDK